MMGKADAGVNLVAGDEDEAVGEYEDEREDEYEGLWVGTLGATELPEEANESVVTTTDQEPTRDKDQSTMEEEASLCECEFESLWVGTVGVAEMPEETDKPAGVTAD
jgi:hypothetical protein